MIEDLVEVLKKYNGRTRVIQKSVRIPKAHNTIEEACEHSVILGRLELEGLGRYRRIRHHQHNVYRYSVYFVIHWPRELPDASAQPRFGST